MGPQYNLEKELQFFLWMPLPSSFCLLLPFSIQVLSVSEPCGTPPSHSHMWPEGSVGLENSSLSLPLDYPVISPSHFSMGKNTSFVGACDRLAWLGKRAGVPNSCGCVCSWMLPSWLISPSASGGVIRLDIAGHQRHTEMGLLWLKVTAFGPCDIVSIDLQGNSFIFCKTEWSPPTGIDVVFAMVFWRVKLFPSTHPKLIPLILVSGHIAFRCLGWWFWF